VFCSRARRAIQYSQDQWQYQLRCQLRPLRRCDSRGRTALLMRRTAERASWGTVSSPLPHTQIRDQPGLLHLWNPTWKIRQRVPPTRRFVKVGWSAWLLRYPNEQPGWSARGLIRAYSASLLPEVVRRSISFMVCATQSTVRRVRTATLCPIRHMLTRAMRHCIDRL